MPLSLSASPQHGDSPWSDQWASTSHRRKATSFQQSKIFTTSVRWWHTKRASICLCRPTPKTAFCFIRLFIKLPYTTQRVSFPRLLLAALNVCLLHASTDFKNTVIFPNCTRCTFSGFRARVAITAGNRILQAHQNLSALLHPVRSASSRLLLPPYASYNCQPCNQVRFTTQYRKVGQYCSVAMLHHKLVKRWRWRIENKNGSRPNTEKRSQLSEVKVCIKWGYVLLGR